MGLFMVTKKRKSVAKSEVSKGCPPSSVRPIRITKAKDAKRLLSRLIFQLQTGEIEGRQAKDITYLLVAFIQIENEIMLEKRVARLEQEMDSRNA
jgi:hypothetical protein